MLYYQYNADIAVCHWDRWLRRDNVELETTMIIKMVCPNIPDLLRPSGIVPSEAKRSALIL